VRAKRVGEIRIGESVIKVRGEKEGIKVEVKRMGYVIDRERPIEMRVGEVLIIY